MEDVEFVKEFVKRLPKPLKSKTSIQLSKIVIDKESVDVAEMCSDEELPCIFTNSTASVLCWVYSFVRDNQEEFING